jgi:hypothetical protein
MRYGKTCLPELKAIAVPAIANWTQTIVGKEFKECDDISARDFWIKGWLYFFSRAISRQELRTTKCRITGLLGG